VAPAVVVHNAAAVVHDVVAARLAAADCGENLTRHLRTRVGHALELASHAILLGCRKTLLGKRRSSAEKTATRHCPLSKNRHQTATTTMNL